MSRAVNPKRFVTFTRAHTVVHPATILEVNGVPVPFGDLPETRSEYYAGQMIEFGSVNAARAFARAMNGAAIVGSL